MKRGLTSSGRDEQERVQVVGDERELDALWNEYHAVRTDLETGELDRQTLRRLEVRARRLCRGVADQIGVYSRVRGGPTREGAVVLSSLAIARRDLAWVHARGHGASDGQIAERLAHALRESSNALALLRWAWG